MSINGLTPVFRIIILFVFFFILNNILPVIFPLSLSISEQENPNATAASFHHKTYFSYFFENNEEEMHSNVNYTLGDQQYNGLFFHNNYMGVMMPFCCFFVVSIPSFLPLYGLLHLFVPMLSSLACHTKVPKVLCMSLLEVSIYYTMEQMLVVHIIYSLYSKDTAWMSALYFGIYFMKHVDDFISRYPQSTVSHTNVMFSMYSFVFYTILSSFYMYSSFSPCSVLLNKSKDSDFSSGKRTLTDTFRPHFEAWTVADLTLYMHGKLWGHYYDGIRFAAKQGYHLNRLF